MFAPFMLALAGSCTTVQTVAVAPPAEAVTVELWTGGDDGLTQGIAEAVRRQFERSPSFTLAIAPTPGALRVTIPTHVEWESVGQRTRVTYRLQLMWKGRELQETQGQCWESELSVCAEQIVTTATRAVDR